MRATLQARIDNANAEREAAETEKRVKEECALSMLAVEEEKMARVAQESRNLDAEEEACTRVGIFSCFHFQFLSFMPVLSSIPLVSSLN